MNEDIIKEITPFYTKKKLLYFIDKWKKIVAGEYPFNEERAKNSIYEMYKVWAMKRQIKKKLPNIILCSTPESCLELIKKEKSRAVHPSNIERNEALVSVNIGRRLESGLKCSHSLISEGFGVLWEEIIFNVQYVQNKELFAFNLQHFGIIDKRSYSRYLIFSGTHRYYNTVDLKAITFYDFSNTFILKEPYENPLIDFAIYFYCWFPFFENIYLCKREKAKSIQKPFQKFPLKKMR